MYKSSQFSSQRNNNNKKKRKQNIIWFNPPFSENLATNIRKKNFLFIVKIFSSKQHRYRKIFDNQNVKLSYSCVPNMGSIIAQYKKQVLNRLLSANTETPPCNCRNKRDCPLEGKCRTKCVICKALINR